MQQNTTAKDIMQPTYPQYSPTTKYNEVSVKLEKYPSVLLVNNRKEYQGMVLQKDVLKGSIKLNTRLSTLQKKTASVDTQENIIEALRHLLENNLEALPVTEDEIVKGVVNRDDIIQTLINQGKYVGKQNIERYLIPVRQLPHITSDTSIATVRKKLLEARESFMLIIDDTSVEGVVTLKSMVSYFNAREPKHRAEKGGMSTQGEFIAEKQRTDNNSVRNIMIRPLPQVKDDITTTNLLKTFIEKKMPVLIVRSAEDGTEKGAIRKEEFLLDILDNSSVPQEPNINISQGYDQFLNRKDIKEVVRDFTKKYPELLPQSGIDIELNEEKEKYRNVKRKRANVRIRTPIGMFVATGRGWEEALAIKDAFLSIDSQVERQRRDNDMFRKPTFNPEWEEHHVKDIKKTIEKEEIK